VETRGLGRASIGLWIASLLVVASGLVLYSARSAPAEAAVSQRDTIAAGRDSTCAVGPDGSVTCWGDNFNGQLGDGGTSAFRFTPFLVGDIDDAVSVASGQATSCALHGDGQVSCWGDNGSGTAGDGTTTDRDAPVKVKGISDAVAISVGGSACAVHDAGEISCWGLNFAGQLGNGSLISSSLPKKVTGITDAVSVAVGSQHACAVRSNGKVSCWGEAGFGQSGDGTRGDAQTNRTTPVQVIGISNAVSVDVGLSFSCAALADGTVSCWGRGSLGQLGKDTGSDFSLSAVKVTGVTKAVTVTASLSYACAGQSDGTVKCWGKNTSGQLGDGTSTGDTGKTYRVTPVKAIGLTKVTSVSAGETHTCATRDDDTVWCWGNNSKLQVGDSLRTLFPTPRPLLGLCQRNAVTKAGPLSGYWMLETDGDLYGFGDATPFCSTDLGSFGSTAVGFDRSADGSKMWVLDSLGKVHVRGAATNRGDAGTLAPGDRVASISATPSGNGYWIFTDLGQVIAKGDAQHFGDLPGLGIKPVGAVVASAPTPSGKGYYMLGSDGGVFAFGDAQFSGSIPQVLPPGALSCPIVGLVPVPTGNGYWMVACDGGVFAFGSAYFVGSVPGVLPAGSSLNAPVNGMVPYANGYLMVASDGGVFNFSNKDFLGSLGATPPDSPIVAISAFTS
jgi:alpha-tubulin suppressor-like RCC1 family protein